MMAFSMLPMLPPASSAAHAASKALAGEGGKPLPPPPPPPNPMPGGKPLQPPLLKFELGFEFEPLAEGRVELPLPPGAAKEFAGAMGVVAALLGELPLPACPAWA